MNCCGVESKAEAMLPSEPSTSACTGFEPICIPNQASSNMWFKPVVSLTASRKLGHEWLVCISPYHSVSCHL